MPRLAFQLTPAAVKLTTNMDHCTITPRLLWRRQQLGPHNKQSTCVDL